MPLGNYNDFMSDLQDTKVESESNPFASVATSPVKTEQPIEQTPTNSPIGSGWTSGVEGLKGLYYGVKSLGAHAIGADETFKEASQDFHQTEQNAKEASKGITTDYRDIKFSEPGGLNRAIDYVGYQVGNALPSLLTSVATGIIGAAAGTAATAETGPGAIIGGAASGIGGAIGKSYVQKQIATKVAEYVGKGMATDVAEQAAKKVIGQQVGASTALFLQGASMGLGDIYNETRDENDRGSILASIVGAPLYGALDAVTEVGMLHRLGKVSDTANALKRYSSEMLSTGLKEGATESAQEALLIATGLMSGKKYNTEDIIGRLGNSFAGGFAGGVMGGGITATTQRTNDPLANAQQEAETGQNIQALTDTVNTLQEEASNQGPGTQFDRFPKVKRLFEEYHAAHNDIQSMKEPGSREDTDKIAELRNTQNSVMEELTKVANGKNDKGDFITKSETERTQATNALDQLKKLQEQNKTNEEIKNGEESNTIPKQEVSSPNEKTSTNEQTKGQEQGLLTQNQVSNQEVKSDIINQVDPLDAIDKAQEEYKQKQKELESNRTKQAIPTTSNSTTEQPATATTPTTQNSVENTSNTVETQDQQQDNTKTTTAAQEPVESSKSIENQRLSELPTNAYGGARGEGFKSKKSDELQPHGLAVNHLEKTFGKDWKDKGTMQIGPNGNLYFVPNDPNLLVGQKEKKTRTPRTKQIQTNTPFTPVDKDGNAIYTDSGMNPKTGRVMHDGNQFLMEKPDGTWYAPDGIMQKRLRNSPAVKNAMPKTGTTATITETPGKESAKDYEKQQKIIQDANQQNKLQEKLLGGLASKMSDASKQEIVDSVNQMQANAATGVKDDIKATLDSKYGNMPYIVYEKLAERFKNQVSTNDKENQTGSVQSYVGEGEESRGTVSQQETSSKETPTSGVLQAPEEVKQTTVPTVSKAKTALENVAKIDNSFRKQLSDAKDSAGDNIINEDGMVYSEKEDDYIPVSEMNIEDRINLLKKYTTIGQQYGTAKSKLSETVDLGEGNQNNTLDQATLEESGFKPFSNTDENFSVGNTDNLINTNTITEHGNNILNKIKDIYPHLNATIYETKEDLIKAAETNSWIRKNLPKLIGRVKGWHLSGSDEIGICAWKFKNNDDIAKTIIHETVGHFGVERIFGSKFTNFLDRVIATSPQLLQKAFETVGSKYKVTHNPNGTIQIGDSRISLTDARGLIKEYIAYVSEAYSNDTATKSEQSLWNRVSKYIKHLLRSLSPNTKFTDEDIHNLVRQSYNNTFGTNKYSLSNQSVFTQVLTNEEMAKAIKEPVENIANFNLMDDVRALGLVKGYRKFANELQNSIDQHTDRFFDQFGILHGRERIKSRQQKILGSNARLNRLTQEATRIIWNKKTNLTNSQHEEIVKAWLSGDIYAKVFHPSYLTTTQVKVLENLSQELANIQAELVSVNYLHLNQDLINKILDSQGRYLHAEYITHIKKDYVGKGWLPSGIDWMKKKKDSTNPTEGKLSTEIYDSEYSIINTINLIGRDVIMMRLQDQIVSDSTKFDLGHILENKDKHKYPVNYRGTVENMTLSQIRKTINNIETSLDESNITKLTDAEIIEGNRRLRELYAAHDNYAGDELTYIKEIMKKHGPPYAQLDADGNVIPNTGISIDDKTAKEYLEANYRYIDPRKKEIRGPLEGHWLDKRIYDVLVSDSDFIKKETSNLATKLFDIGPNSALARATSYWKGHMTVGNIFGSYWPRAVIGSAINMDLASNTNSITLTKYVKDAIQEGFFDRSNAKTYGGKSIMDIGRENGMFSTGFSVQEIYANMDKLARKGAFNTFKEEYARSNIKKSLGAAFDMFTNGYHEVFKHLSDASVNVDAVFKLALIRDYFEIQAKELGFTSGKQYMDHLQVNDLDQYNKVIENASAYAGKGIGEYHDIPNYVRSLRKLPLGSPFLTFTYKQFGIFQRALIARPWKLIKYYAVGHLVTQALMATVSDWDDKDLKEAYSKLPIHMRNKSTLFILPFKDKTGNVAYADMSYTIPHAFITDMFFKLANPEPGMSIPDNTWKTFKETTGILSGPIPKAVEMVVSPNVTDPFSGRDLYQPGDNLSGNMGRYAKYAYNQLVPPWLQADVFGTGNAGGIVSDIFNANYKDEFGKDKNPLWTDIANLTGINFKTFREEDQQKRNIKFFNNLKRKIDEDKSSIIRNRNLSDEDRISQLGDVARRVKELNEQRDKWLGNR